MGKLVKSNGEEKLALSKKDFERVEKVYPHSKSQRTNPRFRTVNGSFNIEHQETIDLCIEHFDKKWGVRLNRTQALDHILFTFRRSYFGGSQ